MHPEANAHEAVGTAVPFALMSTQHIDDTPPPSDEEELALSQRQSSSVLTPAVQRVLAWHQQHRM